MGGIIGAIPWAIVYALGYFVGWLGLLIGFLALKGYTLMGGKINKGTIPIISVAIIISVIFGNILGDCFTAGYYINKGELGNLTYADIPMLLGELFQDGEYLVEFIKNLIFGLVFAGIGVFGMLKNINAQTKTAADIAEKVD